MMLFKRIAKSILPEMMASIIYANQGLSRGNSIGDMSRQLWDEARHAMMGE